MKRFWKILVSLFMVAAFATMSLAASDYAPNKNHSGFLGKDGRAWYKTYSDYFYLNGGTAFQGLMTSTPTAARTWTFPDKSGTVAMTTDVSTAAPAINAVTGAAADTTIAFTAYQGTFTSTLTNKDMFTFQGLGAFGDVSVVRIESKTGNPTDGTVLEVVSHDANTDPLVVSSSAQAGVLTVGQGGTVDIIGAFGVTGASTFTGAVTTTGATTLGNNSATVAIDSSDWNINTVGAMTGIDAITMDGLLTAGLGANISGAAINLNAGSNFVTNIGTGTTNAAVTIGGGSNTVAINSSDWDIGLTGDMTGIGAITADGLITGTLGTTITGAAVNLNASSNFAVNVATGTSTGTVTIGGTGTQAIDIGNGAGVKTVALGSDNTTSATVIKAGTGDLTITSIDDMTINGGSAGSIINIGTNAQGNVINIATDNSALDAITIGSALDTIALASSTWNVSTAGAFTGVADITGTAGEAMTITLAANGAADDLTISVTGAQDSSVILSSAGTGTDAIGIHATAGGIDIDTASTAAAAVDIDATGTVAGNAITINTTDGGVLIQTGGAANGDLTLTVGDAFAMNATGTAAITSSDWGISTTGVITGVASVAFDNAVVLYNTTVACNNACIKGLRAAPLALVATPGADKFIELVSAVLILNYGTNVLTESADNLVIQYTTSDVDITAAIEMTGFIDAAADQMAIVNPLTIPTIPAASAVNNGIELFNTGDGEFAGNAGNDTTLSIRVSYKVHTAGL